MLVNIFILILIILSAGSAFSNFSIKMDPLPYGTTESECERKSSAKNIARFRAAGYFNVLTAILLLVSLFLPEPYIYYTSAGSLLLNVTLKGLMYFDMLVPVHPQCL